MLTIFGFLSSILIGVSYYLSNFNRNYLWLASLGFILNWFGDSLDGNLARYRNIERPLYGFFIDHAMDIMSEVVIFLGLASSPFVDSNRRPGSDCLPLHDQPGFSYHLSGRCFPNLLWWFRTH